MIQLYRLAPIDHHNNDDNDKRGKKDDGQSRKLNIHRKQQQKMVYRINPYILSNNRIQILKYEFCKIIIDAKQQWQEQQNLRIFRHC